MKNKRVRGEVVVEASIIVTLVAIFITIMLYLGMIMYQRTLVSVMANQTASNIAQVYSNSLKDPFTGYVDADRVYQSVTYSNMKNDAYLDILEQKANIFAQYRLKSSKILSTGNTAVDVEIVKKPNELLKSQIVVTVRDKFSVPLVGMFGTDGTIEFTASGRADCVDILEYLYGVEAIGTPESSPIQSLPDADTCLVTFVTDKYSGGFHAVVPVLRGKSIITSNHYTHSSMPANPVYNGLAFTGWITDDGLNFSASTQIDENITVYGAWLCTVTFDPDGGTVTPASMEIGLNKTATFPIPTRNGYAFEGWYTEKNGGGIKYESNVTEITSNITLYAKWTCTHISIKKTLKTPGTCKTRSVWTCKCETCPYTYEEYGDYGSCEAGTYSVTLEPTCTKVGSKVASCKYCGKTLSATKTDIPALGHNFESYSRAATCAKEGVKGQRCKRCGLEQGTIIPKTAHNWNGRCGYTHDMSKYPVNIASHNKSNGYKISTKVECYLCSNCGAPYDGWGRKDAKGTQVSWGVICREHTDNSGYGQKDNAYSSNVNMHVHG